MTSPFDISIGAIGLLPTIQMLYSFVKAIVTGRAAIQSCHDRLRSIGLFMQTLEALKENRGRGSRLKRNFDQVRQAAENYKAVVNKIRRAPVRRIEYLASKSELKARARDFEEEKTNLNTLLFLEASVNFSSLFRVSHDLSSDH
jgi:hypothetical protein